MEKEQKKKMSVESKADAAVETISFDSWFTFKVSEKRKVMAHHYDTLKAYFKKQGLSEQEESKDFDAALKMFGF